MARRRINASQLRSKLRQLESNQRQAVNRYNQAVRNYNSKIRTAVNQYNQAARAHNARVRANRQRLKSELSKLASQTTAHYSTFRVSVESVHDALRERLSAVSDLLVERVNLWAKYEVGLFGGQPRRKSVTKADAEFLADRLAAFRPNYLVLVNAGHVRNHFADKSPQQLAVLTRHINLGALAGQRPYTLILVVDRRIPDDAFAVYWRTCQMMNTFPAAMQFTPSEVDQLVEYARLEVERYTSNHLVIQT